MNVLLVADIDAALIGDLLGRFGIDACLIREGAIPGSYWGDSEAGLLGNKLYMRLDTPVHSVLHEASHFICMDERRRAELDKDAGGDFAEENAVCYLQSLLADALAGFGRHRLWRDMDTWGYTFRLGSAQAWFERDAEECRAWLQDRGIIDAARQLTWKKREDATALA